MGIGPCGALSGGLIALGCKKGRDRDKFEKGKFLINFNACKKLIERFNEEYGCTTCVGLQKKFTGKTYDLWNADEYKEFVKLRGDKCARATELVTRWVLEQLL